MAPLKVHTEAIMPVFLTLIKWNARFAGQFMTLPKVMNTGKLKLELPSLNYLIIGDALSVMALKISLW